MASKRPFPAQAPAFSLGSEGPAFQQSRVLLGPRNQSFPGTPTQAQGDPLQRGSGWTGRGEGGCPQAGREADSSRQGLDTHQLSPLHFTPCSHSR